MNEDGMPLFLTSLSDKVPLFPGIVWSQMLYPGPSAVIVEHQIWKIHELSVLELSRLLGTTTGHPEKASTATNMYSCPSLLLGLMGPQMSTCQRPCRTPSWNNFNGTLIAVCIYPPTPASLLEVVHLPLSLEDLGQR
ncbi:T-cell surface glycoprotein CD1e, membrane-associated [Frankliniella fusca]|uniref:T-cell surface glycoprotein CD1e, membrane-associated n=1 Tax=Frankliniella fusca TaxID=407009 RepID=A0AAE1HXE3_9NEOP|nr:T-cell surface glycoprotein CD1e, membrane-associated [Frankliniella fusca]